MLLGVAVGKAGIRQVQLGLRLVGLSRIIMCVAVNVAGAGMQLWALLEVWLA